MINFLVNLHIVKYAQMGFYKIKSHNFVAVRTNEFPIQFSTKILISDYPNNLVR